MHCTCKPCCLCTAGSAELTGCTPACPCLTHLPARLMAIVGAPTSSASVQNRAAIHHRKVKYII